MGGPAPIVESTLKSASGHNNHRHHNSSSHISHHQMERKLKKPLMEKKRRARINHCLVELKHILLQASPHQRTKLEKADILEMTVSYLRNKQSADMQNARQNYLDGFNQCSNVVLQYFNVAGSLDSNVRFGLTKHLSDCLVDKMKPSTANATGRPTTHVVEPKYPPGVIRPQPYIPLTLTIPQQHQQRSTVSHTCQQQLPTPPFLQEPGESRIVHSRDISPRSQSSSLTITETASFSPCSNYSTTSPSSSDQDDLRSSKETAVWRPW